MSTKKAAAAVSPAPFTLAHARADHWGLAVKACLEGVADAAAGANVGFLYATEAFAADLPSILTFLRETTRIQSWVGAVTPGIVAGDQEYRDGGALAVMVGGLDPDSFRCFASLDAADLRRGIGGLPYGVALVHGDPRNPGLPALVEAAAGDAGFLVGGLVSLAGPPAQVADSVVSGGLSGLLLAPEIEVVAGLTQGCSPLGPSHLVTEASDGVLMKLDGRPALEVLKEDAGELIARDIRRAAGYIHVGLPVPGSDTGDYLVRTLVGMDPRQNWLAVGDRVEVGTRLMFVRRDANAARADMRRMLDGVTA
ncbi:MAG TPA: FIST N-terminal domain-containing protein, partial [Candidatus Omnitrophota bacterium]|nr:FIST N-terminal domain-containing protein [Candidatus Omnitrophota bacterium]